MLIPTLLCLWCTFLPHPTEAHISPVPPVALERQLPQPIAFPDTTGKEGAAEKGEESYRLSVRWYRKGTPLVLLLFNEENNKLLSRQQLKVGEEKRVQVPLQPYLEQGSHDFKLVVVNKRKNRNKVISFSR